MSRQWRNRRGLRGLLNLLALLAAFSLIAAACGSSDPVEETSADDDGTAEAEETTTTEAAAEETAEEEAPEEEAMADGSGASFVSLQFAPVEEADKFRAILEPAGLDVTIGEEGPTLDQILAGAGSVDVLGALHGSFPPLARENGLTNMSDVLDDLSADRAFADSFVESGLLGTDDFLHYVPWAQATYIMGRAHRRAPLSAGGCRHRRLDLGPVRIMVSGHSRR